MSDDKHPWWRWPENRMTGVVPWWVILRRLIFWPLLMAGMCVVFFAVLGGFGLREAQSTWKNIR